MQFFDQTSPQQLRWRRTAPAPKALERVQSLILLGGSLRPYPLASAIARSVLDLPVAQELTLLGLWQQAAHQLAGRLGATSFRVRVVIDAKAPMPSLPAGNGVVDLQVERERRPHRGTGGLLRDLVADYPADSFVLVANAGQVLLEPIARLACALASTNGDACVATHRDGTPTSLMLVKCACLQGIAATGYLDMKEQVLPLLAQQHSVRVIELDRPSGIPIWTSTDYFRALTAYHRRRSIAQAGKVSSRETSWPPFRIVEEGAYVDPTSRLQDAVVLRGARVNRDSVLIRSLICSDGVVGTGRRVVNTIVGGLA